MLKAECRAKWIGIATHQANNFEDYPSTDSKAARWRAEAAKRAKSDARMGIDGRRRRRKKEEMPELLPHEGGHDLWKVSSGKGWFCMTCKTRTACRKKLAVLRCISSAAERWTEAQGDSSHGRRHAMRRSGPIDWCGVCGCFAETRASGLKGFCKGLPSQQLGIGHSSLDRLNNLRAGLHPVIFTQLPEATQLNGEALQGDGVYTRLMQPNGGAEPENFIRYTPELFPAPRPQLNGSTAAEKSRQMIGRIRSKEASEIRRLKSYES